MQAIKELQTPMCQPEAAQQSLEHVTLSANGGMTEKAAETTLENDSAVVSDMSQDASDHQKVAKQDRQPAEKAIARLLASRQGYAS